MNVLSCSQRKKTVYDQQYAQNVRYDNVTTESLIKPAENRMYTMTLQSMSYSHRRFFYNRDF